MINHFLNLDRFVLASDRLPTKYSCDDVLALFDAADQLHLVLGVNVTQRGHHFEILVDDYESLYHLQLNGLDDPSRNRHLDLHPLQPPMVYHLTNVPLGAIKELIQHSTEHRLSYINADQQCTTYRNSIFEPDDGPSPFGTTWLMIHHSICRNTASTFPVDTSAFTNNATTKSRTVRGSPTTPLLLSNQPYLQHHLLLQVSSLLHHLYRSMLPLLWNLSARNYYLLHLYLWKPLSP